MPAAGLSIAVEEIFLFRDLFRCLIQGRTAFLVRIAALVLVIALALVLAGCGSKPSIRTHGPGVDEPYVVTGKKYYPLHSAEGYEEEGMASWYGPGFHGRLTSSGEKYDQNALTAAHTILPFQSEIEVTNLRNGRSVIVRINDRGPFARSRVIDLSRAAAIRLDMIGTGTTRVRLRHVGSSPAAAAPVPREPVEGIFYIQVGAFGDRRNAAAAVRTARRMGMQADIQPGKRLLRVVLGPWQDLNTANDNLWRVRDRFPQAFVVSEED